MQRSPLPHRLNKLNWRTLSATNQPRRVLAYKNDVDDGVPKAHPDTFLLLKLYQRSPVLQLRRVKHKTWNIIDRKLYSFWQHACSTWNYSNYPPPRAFGQEDVPRRWTFLDLASVRSKEEWKAWWRKSASRRTLTSQQKELLMKEREDKRRRRVESAGRLTRTVVGADLTKDAVAALSKAQGGIQANLKSAIETSEMQLDDVRNDPKKFAEKITYSIALVRSKFKSSLFAFLEGYEEGKSAELGRGKLSSDEARLRFKEMEAVAASTLGKAKSAVDAAKASAPRSVLGVVDGAEARVAGAVEKGTHAARSAAHDFDNATRKTRRALVDKASNAEQDLARRYREAKAKL
jgi:hypothetical protein